MKARLNHGGKFKEEEFIKYLVEEGNERYVEAQGLREALKQFDFDNDGKIKKEELWYFMEEFG